LEEEELKQEEVQEEEEQDDEARPVASTMVAEVGYNREANELEVTFDNGKQESYSCTPEQWEELKNAPSVGKWMWANVL
jgi:hypothetical protein